MKKNWLGIIKSAVLLGLVAICMMVSARDAKASTIWNCGTVGDGSNVTATLENGKLTVSGSGAMKDFNPSDLSDMPWKDSRDYITSVEIKDGVTKVGACAFKGCTNLISVSIADSVTEIGQKTFMNCEKLVNIKLPSNITIISFSMFENCNKLTSITIPSCVKGIHDNAFQRSGITSLTLPGGSIIKFSAFSVRYCNSLTTLTYEDISEYPTTYSDYSSFNTPYSLATFDYCPNLKNIVIKKANSIDQITTLIKRIVNCDNSITESDFTNITIPAEFVTEEFVASIRTTYPNATVTAYVPPVDNKMEDVKEESEEASEGTPTGPAKSIYEEKMDSLVSEISAASADSKKSANGKQTVYLKDVTTLSLSAMKMIKNHPNVNLDMTYTYMGVAYHVVIPGSAAVYDESIPWYGPLWLYAHYGQNFATNTANTTTRIYIVQKGDTLRKIAAKFSMTLEELLVKNPQIKNVDRISIGDKIFY